MFHRCGILALLVGLFGIGGLTPASATAGDVWLAADGDDQQTGATPDQAVRSAAAAAKRVRLGDRILLRAGTYPPLKFVELRGTAVAPIVIRPADDAAGMVTLSSGRKEAGIGLTLEHCEHVVVDGLRVTNSLKGIDVMSSRHCVVQNNTVDDLGQEAIHVGRLHTYDGSNQFLGPASEFVQVIGNHVTGTGKGSPQYGEGIYIGTGAFRGDDTHDILIERNILTDISAEGIELKPGTTNLTVRGNQISNTHHEYNAAITVCVEGTDGASGNYLIEHNRIWGIKQVKHGVAAIAIGHGNAVIRNNLIWNIEGGIGIRVYQTFANPQALQITLERNTVIGGPPTASILLHEGTAGGQPTPHKALVKSLGNLTDDGSAGSQRATPSQFRGPFRDDADSGTGPGTGFQLKKPSSRMGVDMGALLKASSASSEPER